ncbi:YezD family protein [Novosphingobium sp. SL115]|uniref:YezD family protein n=1 Tax=Novosphingobium sp. SL115 TaxID=2995150 RepID=UPI0022767EF8|nr:YezD family protein [Novosphingobium sp. SL115]MCY1671936.1 YezD family protein [Novosphingobium sp. SL115]
MSQTNPPAAPPGPGESVVAESHIEESLASVREALTGLRYGNVSLTIHEGRVVQIDVTEKRRLKPN